MKMYAFATLLALVAAGCGTEIPSTVVVDNDYPVVADGGDPTTEMTVYKVWWATTLLPDPVRPGEEGQSQRTVANTDFAYAVLAPGWDPSSPNPPARLIAAKSGAKLSVARGDVLRVHVSDETFFGNCAGGKPLSQVDADLITRSIFPAEFTGVTYAAPTCAAVPSGEGGVDAAPGAGDDSGDAAIATDGGVPASGAPRAP